LGAVVQPIAGFMLAQVCSALTRAAAVFDPSGSSAAQFAKAREALARSSDTPRAPAAIVFMRDLLSAVRSSPSTRLGKIVNHAKA
jgi:hypothetical protein